MLRHRDFFPVLYMPEDQLGNALVVHDHRLIFTLDVTLEQSINGQRALVIGFDDDMPADGPGYDIALNTGNIDVTPHGTEGYSLQDAIASARSGFQALNDGAKRTDNNDWLES